MTDDTGAYMIMGLDPGDYEVTAALDLYDTSAVETINIVVGNKTVWNFELDLTNPVP